MAGTLSTAVLGAADVACARPWSLMFFAGIGPRTARARKKGPPPEKFFTPPRFGRSPGAPPTAAIDSWGEKKVGR